ncbi:hypothetical protein Q0812_12665 [Brevundimonas sp. 2R-24]|uniref:Uncharacterized protein n=1 Tax=Peiella sedimenti TaxID=3061083 RepID=A0ABT8SNY3_9CAUL|nr:hypothetical protein [Caulobacteraceae bacterium XZ-24]
MANEQTQDPQRQDELKGSRQTEAKLKQEQKGGSTERSTEGSTGGSPNDVKTQRPDERQ